MNYANFRRELSDSWLTFTTNRRDQLALLLARWSCCVYGDEDTEEWLCSVAKPAGTLVKYRQGKLKRAGEGKLKS